MVDCQSLARWHPRQNWIVSTFEHNLEAFLFSIIPNLDQDLLGQADTGLPHGLEDDQGSQMSRNFGGFVSARVPLHTNLQYDRAYLNH